ncbi:MAG: glycosyltransferase family 2 protein [Armatimonadetes bacterium]|nr:glycosyltransferase family 2 protein [Armatimonadota bacterium]
MESAPSVHIILVNWNGIADTMECLRSLSRVTYPNCSVIVVDNGSREDEAGALRAAFPAVTVLATGENLGFTGGNNVGIRHALGAGAEYVLCLNNDTVVDPGFLEPLVAALEGDPGAGLAAPHIFLYGEPRDLWYAGAEYSFDLETLRARRGPAWHVIPTAADLERTEPHETQIVTGCALLARTGVMRRLGGFDERYFAYYEDVELNLRVAGMGLRRLVVPASRVWHKESRSTGGPMSPTVYFYMVRNTFMLAQDHAPGGPSAGNAYYRHYARISRQVARSLMGLTQDSARDMERALAILHGLQCAAEGRYGRREGSYRFERTARLRLAVTLWGRRFLQATIVRAYWYFHAHVLCRLRKTGSAMRGGVGTPSVARTSAKEEGT